MSWWEVKHLANRQGERLLIWFVWRLPRKLVMWCYLRVLAHATTGRFGNIVVTDITAMEAIGLWYEPNGR